MTATSLTRRSFFAVFFTVLAVALALWGLTSSDDFYSFLRFGPPRPPPRSGAGIAAPGLGHWDEASSPTAMLGLNANDSAHKKRTGDGGELLEPMGALLGYVRNHVDSGVAEAEVRLLSIDQRSPALDEVILTDRSGYFQFPGLTAGLYELRVRHDQYASNFLTNITLNPDEVLDSLLIILTPGVGQKGIVVDQRDKPLSDVKLEARRKILRLNPSGGEPIAVDFPVAEATTEDNGRFVMEHLPEAELTILASKPGYNPTPTDVALGADSEPGDLKIVLKSTGRIGGRVRDSEGLPVRGAKLETTTYRKATGEFEPQGDKEKLGATTSADGNFVLEGLQNEGWYSFKIEAKGYATSLEEEIPVNSVNNEFVLDNEARITGRVTNFETNQPEPGLRLRLASQEAPVEILRDTKSDANGDYVFDSLPAGLFAVWVDNDKLTAAPREKLNVKTGETLKNINFEVYIGGSVAGLVLDGATGEPLPWAKVKASGRVGERLVKNFSKDVAADAFGEFLLPNLPAGDYDIVASASGYLPPRANIDKTRVSLGRGEAKTGLQFELWPGGVITGEVVSSSGEGVAFARVHFFHSRSSPKKIPLDNFQTGTSFGGKFTMLGFDYRGVIELVAVASAPGFAPGQSSTIRLSESDHAAETRIVLEKGFTVTGRVVNEQKQPFAGARIVANSPVLAPDPFRDKYVALSASDGTYRISNLPKGSASLTASAPDYVDSSQSVKGENGEVLENIDFVLRQGLTISGVAFDDKGERLEGVQVQASGENGAQGSGSGQSDEQGFYRVHQLGEGKFTLRANHTRPTPYGNQRYSQVRRGVPSGQGGADFLFPINASLRGKVVSEDQLEPITNYTLNLNGQGLQGDGGRFAFKLKNVRIKQPDGLFELVMLPEGVFDLTIVAGDHVVKTIEKISLKSPGSKDLGDLVLQKGGGLKLRVLGEDLKQPLAGVSASLLPGNYSAGSNSNGEISMGSLKPGHYTLKLAHRYYLPRTIENVQVEAGESQDLGECYLESGASLEGNVMDGSGEPIPGARIAVQDVLGEKVSFSDADGHYIVEGLSPGQQQVEVTAKLSGKSYSSTEQVHLTAGEVNWKDFVFDNQYRITGRLTAGRWSLADLHLTYYRVVGGRVINNEPGPVRVASDGSYAIEGLIPGTYLLVGEGRLASSPEPSAPAILRILNFAGVSVRETQLDLNFSQGQFSGWLREPTSGEMLPQADVVLTLQNQPAPIAGNIFEPYRYILRTDDEGRFNAYGLPGGTYSTVVEWGGGFRHQIPSVTLKPHQALLDQTLLLE
ncbi:MAG: carboxypeptidase-like regulatory domain-containing protein [bacterium]